MKLLLRITRAEPQELAASLWAFVYFFSLLAGYYVLRPIRDEMAIQGGERALSELFTAVFLSMLVLVPVFGALTSRFPRKQLLPWLYAFFAANLVAFFVLFEAGNTQDPRVAKTFFVWVSVFNLFAVSLFWSLMADIFETAQAKRLYGFIAAGGTAGALTGPSLTALFVLVVGVKGMVLVSAGFLVVAMIAIVQLRRWSARHPRSAPATEAATAPGSASAAGPVPSSQAASRAARDPAADDRALGGGPFSGLVEILRSPYLAGICLFLFCYALLSTLLYFAQTSLVPAAIASSAERTRLLATVDLAVNLLTLAIQLFAFGTLIQRFGTGFMLALMPMVSLVGFAVLASWPLLTTLIAFGILRRAGEYAVSRPTRETLFNALPASQKYKAKNIIDTVVHRGGDALSSWIFGSLRAMGLSLTTMAWMAVPVSALWLATGLLLGRAAARRGAQAGTQGSPGAPSGAAASVKI